MTVKIINKTSDFLISLVLAIGIIVLVNFFAWRFSWRFDLTENKAFSISHYSQTTVKELPDVVTAKAYFSKDLPPQFSVVREQVADLLNEYASYGSNFRIKYLDPGDGKEAEAAGIPKLQFNDVRRDKLEVANGYFGIALSYHGKIEVIPMVEDASLLEYQLTTTIKKLTATGLPTVGWLASAGPSQDSYGQSRQALEKIYAYQDVNLADGSLAKTTALVLADPAKNFSKAELAALDRYLVGGRNVLVLYDDRQVSASLSDSPNPGNLKSWLAGHGLKISDALVLDSQSGVASFGQGYMSYSLPYAYWPKLTADSFNEDKPIFAKLEGVVLPWATGLSATQASSSFHALASSSPRAWAASGSYSLAPDKIPAQQGQLNQEVLAAEMLVGKGKLIVVGDADFAKDQFVSANPANLAFFQDLADYALQEDGLSAIRAKSIISHPLKELPADRIAWLRYLNVGGGAVLVLLAGVWQFVRRRRTKYLEY